MLPDLTFDAWKKKLLKAKLSDDETDPRAIAPELLLYEDADLSAYYAPFYREVLGAPLSLCGLTPGLRQWTDAIAIAQEGIKANRSKKEIALAVQDGAAFAGTMRRNLVSMLDELGLPEVLGLPSLDQAFNGAAQIHMTSVLRVAVFRNGKNYSGTPPPSKQPFLRELVLNLCGPELARVKPQLIVPLGKAVEDGLRLLVDAGIISDAQCLWGFPHPSGANGHRKKQFRARFDEMRKTIVALSP